MLRVSPEMPPARGTPEHVIAKVEYIMSPENSAMAKAVEEIIDLPVIRDVVMKMVKDQDPLRVEAALKLIPNLIVALVRAARSPAKESEVSPALDESELA
jgi:hypothetical protein